jgi:hypothetical protein
MSTCRTCAQWSPTGTFFEQDENDASFEVGYCDHDAVSIPVLEPGDGGYYVLTTEDAGCEHHEAKP